MGFTQIVDYLKTHWVSVMALVMVVWNYAAPTVTNYVANHPHLSFWYGLAAVVVAFYIKSPVTPPASGQVYTPKHP